MQKWGKIIVNSETVSVLIVSWREQRHSATHSFQSYLIMDCFVTFSKDFEICKELSSKPIAFMWFSAYVYSTSLF